MEDLLARHVQSARQEVNELRVALRIVDGRLKSAVQSREQARERERGERLNELHSVLRSGHAAARGGASPRAEGEPEPELEGDPSHKEKMEWLAEMEAKLSRLEAMMEANESEQQEKKNDSRAAGAVPQRIAEHKGDVTVTFDEPPPLGITWKVNEKEGKLTIEKIRPGTAATSKPELELGLMLTHINDDNVGDVDEKWPGMPRTVAMMRVTNMLRDAGRPVTLTLTKHEKEKNEEKEQAETDEKVDEEKGGDKHAAPASELPDELWAAVGSAGLGVTDLGRLARASPRFGLHKSFGDDTERWTLAEEAARRALLEMPESIRACVPRDKGQDWTSLLSEAQALQAPLAFTDCGKDVVLSEDGAVATQRPRAGVVHSQPALVRSPAMRAGKFFAEINWISGQRLNFVRTQTFVQDRWLFTYARGFRAWWTRGLTRPTASSWRATGLLEMALTLGL
eukprot:COSAG04_NODE_1810_length_5515_cov_6.783419_6_plen_454_part_00